MLGRPPPLSGREGFRALMPRASARAVSRPHAHPNPSRKAISSREAVKGGREGFSRQDSRLGKGAGGLRLAEGPPAAGRQEPGRESVQSPQAAGIRGEVGGAPAARRLRAVIPPSGWGLSGRVAVGGNAMASGQSRRHRGGLSGRVAVGVNAMASGPSCRHRDGAVRACGRWRERDGLARRRTRGVAAAGRAGGTRGGSWKRFSSQLIIQPSPR
jgi:hypothetical protein